MKFSQRRLILSMTAIGIIGAASAVAFATDTPPTSGVVNGSGSVNVWGQCVSGTGGTLPIFGRILPPASGSSKVSYKNDYVTAEVYNGSSTTKTVTLATYKEYYKHENYDDVFSPSGQLILLGQRVNDYEEIVVPPYSSVNVSAQMFTAEMPWCATQIDLFCGKSVNTLMGPNRLAQRKLAWYHAHDTTSNPPNLTWCGTDCKLNIMDITNTTSEGKTVSFTEGQKVEPGTKLNIGATTTGRTPYAVRFTLEGPNGLVPTPTNDQRRPPYTYSGDTSNLPEGDYTLTVSVFDTYRFENNIPCDTKTVHFRIVRAHCIKAGLMTVDYCSLSPTMTVDSSNSSIGLPTSQEINIPAWIETYNDDKCSTIEGGLPVKVSSVWSVVHPSIDSSDAREQAAATEMLTTCPGCKAGQVDDQVLVSDASGKIDLNLKVWWPGIMQAYASQLPDYPTLSPGPTPDTITRISDGELNALYQDYVSTHNLGALIVEDHYGMTVAGGSKGNFPVFYSGGQAADLVNSISWSPKMYSYNYGVGQDLQQKDPHYQHANGCVLTLTPDTTQ